MKAMKSFDEVYPYLSVTDANGKLISQVGGVTDPSTGKIISQVGDGEYEVTILNERDDEFDTFAHAKNLQDVVNYVKTIATKFGVSFADLNVSVGDPPTD